MIINSLTRQVFCVSRQASEADKKGECEKEEEEAEGEQDGSDKALIVFEFSSDSLVGSIKIIIYTLQTQFFFLLYDRFTSLEMDKKKKRMNGYKEFYDKN